MFNCISLGSGGCSRLKTQDSRLKTQEKFCNLSFLLSSVFFLFSLLIFPFHVHAETNDVCVASYDSANEVLTVPCVAVDLEPSNKIYSATFQTISDSKLLFLGYQENPNVIADKCIASYSVNTGSLDISCLDESTKLGASSVTLKAVPEMPDTFN